MNKNNHGSKRLVDGWPKDLKNKLKIYKWIYCAYCGKQINGRKKKYCSKKCKRNALRKRMGIISIERICPGCGKRWIDNRNKQGKQIYCSIECGIKHYKDKKKAFKIKICKNCGKRFETQNNSNCCSLKCASKIKSKKAKKRWPQFICKKCGKKFRRKKRNDRGGWLYCSRKCAGNGIIGKAKTKRGLTSGNSYYRAKYYNVEYEPINPITVFERDGWHCQICGKNTPKRNRGTKYSNAPELDHRVPMSLGGGHLYSNVQCVCKRCNAKKGNRNSIGQLPLFGVGSISETIINEGSINVAWRPKARIR